MESSQQMNRIRSIIEEIARVPINIETRANTTDPRHPFYYPILLHDPGRSRRGYL